MKTLVVDASAALAWIWDEPGGSRVAELVGERDTMLVPWFFWLEVANALSRRRRWHGPEIMAAVHDLELLGLTTEAPSRPEFLAVIDATQRHRLTAYDATYLVLAEAADADLVTGDAFLAAAAGGRAILVGGAHRLAEARVRYESTKGRSPDWSRWPGAAAYILQLRREVEAELAAVRARAARS